MEKAESTGDPSFGICVQFRRIAGYPQVVVQTTDGRSVELALVRTIPGIEQIRHVARNLLVPVQDTQLEGFGVRGASGEADSRREKVGGLVVQVGGLGTFLPDLPEAPGDLPTSVISAAGSFPLDIVAALELQEVHQVLYGLVVDIRFLGSDVDPEDVLSLSIARASSVRLLVSGWEYEGHRRAVLG